MTILPDHFWAISGGAAAIAVLALAAALNYRRKKHLVDDLPTSQAEGVFIGLVELEGTAETEQPLTSHLAEKPCVFYRWEVAEHWRKTETVTYRDKDGKTRTRTKTTSGWTTLARGEYRQPFYLQDASGIILVHPAGARIEPVELFSRRCRKTDPLYYGKGPAKGILHSTGERRFVEHGIPLHRPIYLVGQAKEREDLVAPMIAHDPQAPLFLISTRSAHQVSHGYGVAYWALAIAGLALLLGAHFMLWRDQQDWNALWLRHGWPWYAGYLVVWLFGWLLTTYNSLIDLRQRVRRAWSTVEVQLKRRATLIPQIVSVLQALRDHERLLLTTLTQLRTQATATEPGLAGPDPAACRAPLRAVVENYPQLKSDQGFAQLQQELARTEERIALARAYFNEICTFYNTRLQIIPDALVAKLANCRPHPLIQAENFERATVSVKLAD